VDRQVHILLDEQWKDFEVGMFSSNVGPHTEYHFLPEAAPRNGWSVACFGTRPAGSEWRITKVEGQKAMEQTFFNERSHTHPMVSAGDPLWGNYSATVRFRPLSVNKRCGLVVRYHNNRCYTFFGFDEDRMVILQVNHESDFHVPFERLLASAPAPREGGKDYTATVELEGDAIRATIEGIGTLEASKNMYLQGKIALLADHPAIFFSVRVEAAAGAMHALNVLRSKQERLLLELREQYPKPVLWTKIETPGFGVNRNIRFGDIDGDGRKEIVIAQVDPHGERDEYSETGCITAVDLDGNVRWQSGEPDPSKYKLTNDVAFQVHDIDRDGRCEVIYARNFELVIADGESGRIIKKTECPKAKPPADRYERIMGDCLFFCDLRGTGWPQDIVIKDRYWHFWVYNQDLQPLWEADCNTGHYPYAYDVDEDGHDELAVGYSLFDHDGRLMWTLEHRLEDHADGVAILDFQESADSKPKILYAASDEGLLFVDTDGNILQHHRIGHAQNPVVARFRDDIPGLQAVSINFWGNQGILHFFDGCGNIYCDAEPLNMGSMCLPINWSDSETELFVLNAHPELGGMFDGWGHPAVLFPDDGHPDTCNAVVDLTGDPRDEVLVWDARQIWIYTQEDNPRSGRHYCPQRNMLYNSSNYQASISIPGRI
jgi:rhamnogalacturonan endolyase